MVGAIGLERGGKKKKQLWGEVWVQSSAQMFLGAP
ncbi:hypothetical protein Nmel_004975 [Mimus melanotis]